MLSPDGSLASWAAWMGPGGAELSAVLAECERDGGEASPFPVGDGLQGQLVHLVPGAPLPGAGGGVLGAVEPGWAPVDGVLGQQVGDVGGGGVQGACELGNGEVAAGHGLHPVFRRLRRVFGFHWPAGRIVTPGFALARQLWTPRAEPGEHLTDVLRPFKNLAPFISP